jgi:hypothetical protein
MPRDYFYPQPALTTYRDHYKVPVCVLLKPTTSHGTLRRENILPTLPRPFNTAINNLFKAIDDPSVFRAGRRRGSDVLIALIKFKNKIIQQQFIDTTIDGWTLFHFIYFCKSTIDATRRRSFD